MSGLNRDKNVSRFLMWNIGNSGQKILPLLYGATIEDPHLHVVTAIVLVAPVVVVTGTELIVTATVSVTGTTAIRIGMLTGTGTEGGGAELPNAAGAQLLKNGGGMTERERLPRWMRPKKKTTGPKHHPMSIRSGFLSDHFKNWRSLSAGAHNYVFFLAQHVVDSSMRQI